MKSPFEMSSDEYLEYQRKEIEKLMLICPICLGSGEVSEGGTFSKSYKCDYVDCKAKKYERI